MTEAGETIHPDWDTDVACSVACDYITALAPDSKIPGELHSASSHLIRHEVELGNKMEPWSMSGFRGWRAGHVEIGVRDETVMCRLSSNAAALNWSRLASLSTRVTRFDVQATVKVADGPSARIDFHRGEAQVFCASSGGNQLARWIQDTNGGYTLYLGSRHSNVFGRIYDKFARNREPWFEGCVRYEVQFNKRLARVVSNQLLRATDKVDRMGDIVCRFLEARGVSSPSLSRSASPWVSCRSRTDVDRTLLWLAASVRPSIERLINCGRGEEALRALGLIVDDGPPSGVLGH